MLVVKRNGNKVPYSLDKISSAVEGPFKELGETLEDPVLLEKIDEQVRRKARSGVISVEAIQDIVEDELIYAGYIEEAKSYVKYRYEHELARQKRNDQDLLDMVTGTNEYWNSENSNKNGRWVTTQRDYMAGIVSTDLARKYIFPPETIKAHDEGIIHIHDMDYAAQNTLGNCCLINLEDMLQNGTVINGVSIEKPHRLSTAMTITTQIIAAVASSQYGGTTITLTHLAPFVRMSYDGYVNKYLQWGFEESRAKIMAMADTKKEVKDSIQILNYQLNSLTTTNGQSPFISINCYLGETEEYKKELAVLIKELLNQRIEGMKNRVGVPVTTAFPKLLYVLEEDNIHHDSPYWYLTELAAKCTAKRMVPDYISEKMMRKLKLSKGEVEGEGDTYPCINQPVPVNSNVNSKSA